MVGLSSGDILLWVAFKANSLTSFVDAQGVEQWKSQALTGR